jgi:hypothetical protein
MKADDYFAIQNLLFSYPFTLDRGDFDAVGRLFAHADALPLQPVIGDLSAHGRDVGIIRPYRAN